MREPLDAREVRDEGSDGSLRGELSQVLSWPGMMKLTCIAFSPAGPTLSRRPLRLQSAR